MNLFFELLQVALFERERLSRTPSEKEWEELFTISSEQAVVGITLAALDRMECKEMRPPTTILLEWIGAGEQIRDQNKLLNRRCGDVTKLFADAGFRSCILKGQGRCHGDRYSDIKKNNVSTYKDTCHVSHDNPHRPQRYLLRLPPPYKA